MFSRRGLFTAVFGAAAGALIGTVLPKRAPALGRPPTAEVIAFKRELAIPHRALRVEAIDSQRGVSAALMKILGGASESPAQDATASASRTPR
jgi:hypothetical protein